MLAISCLIVLIQSARDLPADSLDYIALQQAQSESIIPDLREPCYQQNQVFSQFVDKNWSSFTPAQQFLPFASSNVSSPEFPAPFRNDATGDFLVPVHMNLIPNTLPAPPIMIPSDPSNYSRYYTNPRYFPHPYFSPQQIYPPVLLPSTGFFPTTHQSLIDSPYFSFPRNSPTSWEQRQECQNNHFSPEQNSIEFRSFLRNRMNFSKINPHNESQFVYTVRCYYTRIFKALLECFFSVNEFSDFVRSEPNSILILLYNFYCEKNFKHLMEKSKIFLYSFFELRIRPDYEKPANNTFVFTTELLKTIRYTYLMAHSFQGQLPFSLELRKFEQNSNFPNQLKSNFLSIYSVNDSFDKESVFSQNIYNDDEKPRMISEVKLTYRRKMNGYFICDKSIILYCQPRLGIEMKKVIFCEDFLKNGIKHKNLGKLIIKSALIFSVHHNSGEFASICLSNDGQWYKTTIESRKRFDIVEWLMDDKTWPLLIFFDIQK